MIPMVVLRVKAHQDGLLTLGALDLPTDVVEGEEIEARALLERPARGVDDDLRVDIDATLSYDDPWVEEAAGTGEEEALALFRLPLDLPRQVVFVQARGAEVSIRFKADTGQETADERRAGVMRLTLTVTASYREGYRTVRKTQTRQISVHLNADRVIRRVSPGLGNILGMMPKSLRG